MEIGQLAVGTAVTVAVKLDTFLNLLRHALLRGAVGWIEGVVETVGAAASGNGAVAVGTGKAGVYRQLLHAPAKAFL